MARGKPQVVERDEHRFAVARERLEPFQRGDLVPGVEACVGSSARIRGVSCASARAIRTRACSPPESSVAAR
jgi:hypothetical protein